MAFLLPMSVAPRPPDVKPPRCLPGSRRTTDLPIRAACKAGRVRVAKWYGPPSETNFGGALLTGDLPACEAAARAFADAVVDVCGAPLRGDPRLVATAGATGGAGADLSRLLETVADGRFRALETGERFADKPDHLTHLRDDASLVPKTHPRIVARGKLDLL